MIGTDVDLFDEVEGGLALDSLGTSNDAGVLSGGKAVSATSDAGCAMPSSLRCNRSFGDELLSASTSVPAKSGNSSRVRSSTSRAALSSPRFRKAADI